MLENRKIVIMGLFDPDSIAWETGKAVRRYGGEVIFTSIRPELTAKLFQREKISLEGYPVLECNVSSDEQLEKTFREIGPINGLVYSIGYAPEDCLGADIFRATRENIMKTFDVSAVSFVLAIKAALPYLQDKSSIVTLTVDSSRAWSFYGWMGPAKAALEAEARYAAQVVGRGIRVNVISCGPLETRAAKGIPGLTEARSEWTERAPLGWDITDRRPVAEMTAFLLSENSSATTGAVIPVDGGFLSVGV